MSRTRGRQELAKIWPLAKIPVLRDETADLMLPESTTIIEYLNALAPNGPALVPAEAGGALQARLWDRFHDQYIANPTTNLSLCVPRRSRASSVTRRQSRNWASAT